MSDSFPLPIASDNKVQALTATASGPLPRFADGPLVKPSDGTRILIVEDSEDHCELLLHRLRKSNLDAHVKIIGDGQAAWDYLERSCRSDELIAIFLDLHIPSIDGLQLLRRIRRHPDLVSVSIIVITSSDNPADREECRALNVSAFVSKPISFSTFSKTVADVFHSAETRTQRTP